MKSRNKLLAVTALCALFSGVALAANMTEQQIKDAAIKAQPGTVELAKLEKKGAHELWEVKVKGNDGKEHTLYFTQAGEHVSEMGKPIK